MTFKASQNADNESITYEVGNGRKKGGWRKSLKTDADRC